MVMTRMSAPLEGLFDLTVDRELWQYVRLQSTIFVMLSKMSPALHRQTELNLGRGWCSSISDRAFKLYCMFAARFEFPVFVLGRSHMIIVSCKRGSPAKMKEFVEKYEALWSLGKVPEDRHWRDHYFNTHITEGPADGWAMITMNRPRNMSIQGLLHAGGWNTIWDVVPKDRTLEALAALKRNEIFEVHINS